MRRGRRPVDTPQPRRTIAASLGAPEIGRATSEGRRVLEPRIQYAQTEDRVSIAFWMFGEGESLILTSAGGISLSVSVPSGGRQLWSTSVTIP